MKVAIIGGGAAGLMTAATLSEHDPDTEVVLVERNDSLGKKVVISGGGRCNVTTGIEDVRTVLANYPRGGKFLTSAMYAFPPASVRGWFEDHGVPLYCQDDMRVFPQSDNGNDVVDVFDKLFRGSRVEVRLGASATTVTKNDGRFTVTFKDGRPPLSVDAVVLTTGGQAYRHTGSTGDGYAFAIGLGHTLTALAPGLTALTTKEDWTADVSGLSFTKARIWSDADRSYDFTGPFIFSHKGLSGPGIFAFSSLIAYEKLTPEKPLAVSIDLFPTLTTDDIRSRIDAARLAHPARSITNITTDLVPRSLADVCLGLLDVDGTLRADQTPKKTVLSIARWLKGIPLTVDGRVNGDEFVTVGGIPLTEIDPRTLESKICPGLYFAGEIMDVDGFTGGFNLQASWAAGHLVGTSIIAATL